MSEVAQWLESLGLSEYAAAFAANRVDLSILPDLTDSDLKELGIPLGDRRRLQRAIAALKTSAPPAHEEGAERRQLTLMFCDLVGSTAMSSRLDPEDLRDVIAAYHRCCAEQIQAAGGFVAKYMGDGVLVYFGYPGSYEDDAERAVRAALALVEAVPDLVTAAGMPLQVRIGIATGLVVVGDLVGSGQAQERGVVGETPNLAARLQSIAQPNMVVISDSTRRLVGSLFGVRDLGAQQLKGIPGRPTAWAVEGVHASKSRFEALHAASLVELTGRQSESATLAQCWTRAATGEGQIVLLEGEAGIGKSRLVAELGESIASRRHALLHYFCSPHHVDSAFHPVIDQVERNKGFISGGGVTKLDRLEAMFAEAGDRAIALSPAQRRQRTLDGLVAHVEALALSAPLLLVFEDAHWSDPSSLEFIGRVIERVGALRAMVVVTFRPEFAPPWVARPGLAALRLGRLSDAAANEMMNRVPGSRAIPAELRRRILERADGIPLFVQEMTRAALEEDAPGAQSVPASLQASLQARLDRLGEAREVAQLGAAIGREFSYSLLSAVSGKHEAALTGALERLVAAGLLFRQGTPSGTVYVFNHALVQDAAYASLLRRARRDIHARIAQCLESRFVDLVRGQPELLARHCTEAGLLEKAASLWGEAGRRSLTRSALLEAAEQLGRAIAQIASLPGSPALRRLRIRFQVDLSNALIHTKGHAAPETRAAFDQARVLMEEAAALGETPEDPLVLYSILYGSWVVNRMTFRGDIVLPLAQRFQELAAADRSVVPRMVGHMIAGISLVLTGEAAAGRAELDQAVALYDPAEHRSLATRFGHDIRVTASAWRAYAEWALGDLEAALADVALTLSDGRKGEQAASLMFALSHASLTLLHAGRCEQARGLVEELIELADRKETLYWKSYGLILQGWLAALAGDAAEAIGKIESGMSAMRSTGATGYAPWYLSILARAHAETGQFDDASSRIAEALTLMETTGERWCEVDVRRRAAEIERMIRAG